MANFSESASAVQLILPKQWQQNMQMTRTSYPLIDLITEQENTLTLAQVNFTIDIELEALGTFVYELDLEDLN